MSLIRKCDICGREIGVTDVYYVVDENVPLLKMKQDIDVCKRCMERLIEEVKDDKGRSDFRVDKVQKKA